MNKYKFTENMKPHFIWKALAFLFFIMCLISLGCGVIVLCRISTIFMVVFIVLALVTFVPIFLYGK